MSMIKSKPGRIAHIKLAMAMLMNTKKVMVIRMMLTKITDILMAKLKQLMLHLRRKKRKTDNN
jgi:hypothetical protein